MLQDFPRPPFTGLCAFGYQNQKGHLSKLPAFQFYPGDWRKDPGVQSLNFHDRGVWFELICLMHESEQRGKMILNGKAMPVDAMARLLGLDNQILTTTLTTLLTYGVTSVCAETGAVMCRRMVRDEEIRQIRSEAGKLGGNPALLKQKPTTKDKQIPTPSSSSSSSSSSSKKENHAPTALESHFEDCWKLYPKRDGKAKALKAFMKSMKDGAKPEDVLAGINRYLAFMRDERANGFPDRAYQSGSTFFTQESWKSEFTSDRKPKSDSGGSQFWVEPK